MGRIGEGHRRSPRVVRWRKAIGAVLVCLAGVRRTAELRDLSSGFVRAADIDAMQWINRNVAHRAPCHISTHFWTPIVAHGLDTGYWIPLLAYRQTTLPVKTCASDGSLEYMELVNAVLGTCLPQSGPGSCGT